MNTARPAHWELIALGDYIDVARGASPRPKGDPRYFLGNIPWISIRDINAEKGKFLTKTAEGVTSAGAQKSRLVELGGLILSNSASVCIPKILKIQGCIHDGFVTFPSIKNNFDTTYLYYYFDWLRPSVIDKHKQGVTQVNLNTEIIKSFEVPVPPLAEQTRIAAKLDELLAQVDTLKARIDGVPALLKRFRQSVLSAAVSGRLTEEWRTESESYIHPYASEWKWHPLPQSWQVKFYAEVTESRLGKMLDKAKNSGIPTKYLGNINVRWFDFELSSLQKIPISTTEREELAIRYGDILICEGGEPGRCAIWDSRLKETIVFQKAIHRARVSSLLLPKWLAFNLKHDADGLILEQLFTGTTIKHLTGKALRNYPLRVPPLEEQTEIVRRVEQLFAFADQLEARIKAAQARIDRLTQSILAKAFRGELVPQDPNDEPASVLLERIKAQRAAAPKAKRGRGAAKLS
ncbi:restriction endonuclease subunit S [Pseudomonas sp. Snoq117.2]|uniref:restriction endonuclease subunit S n=1 Tax=Pseudomonas sp. Snoq117.2 TaxID=1500302 RepID=UPI0008B84209|nr:restriction endonuclease subunit S [Pseudomonas sp. Snoq117.2]SEP36585.1 Type I restriction modification DNA specificity domain-containing protein [Pseudomonas sp. Snoq117.2]